MCDDCNAAFVSLSSILRGGAGAKCGEMCSRLVTSARPAPVVASNKVEVPARTVLVNSTHTTEELEHQRSMQQLRMELESAHQAGKLAQQEIDQLRAKTECVVCLDKERDAVLFPCMQASCCHM